MQDFQKILVGIDLAEDGNLVGESLAPSTRHAIERGCWLARQGGGELVFVYVLPEKAQRLSRDQQQSLMESDPTPTVADHAREVMQSIVDESQQAGCRAKFKILYGQCWMELIREVIRGSYDLLIAGTRKKGPFRGMFIGHTGNKLIRSCPSPVWIAKPEDIDGLTRILVAHDLRDIGAEALRLGAWLAANFGAQLHVLHAIELSVTTWADIPSTEQATSQLREQVAELNLPDVTVEVCHVNDSPEDAILKYVEDQRIDLLVIGTQGRSGIPGWFVGNTAERVLPSIACSILAIKPPRYKSPVLLDNDQMQDSIAR